MKKQNKKPYLVAVKFKKSKEPILFEFKTAKAQELFCQDLEQPNYKRVCTYAKTIS